MPTHNLYDVGDVAVLSYALTDASGTAYEPAAPGCVYVRVYLPGGALGIQKRWLAAGGGDTEIVRDGVGLFHLDYSLGVKGDHRYEFQAYSDSDALATSSIEREVKHFIGRS